MTVQTQQCTDQSHLVHVIVGNELAKKILDAFFLGQPSKAGRTMQKQCAEDL